MRTQSETLFEEFCRLNSISCHRIPESDVRSPDYLVRLGDTSVACEIKQFETSERERESMRQTAEGNPSAFWVKNRLRDKLKRVSPQLKQAAAEGTPTLLVVFDNSHFGMELSDYRVKEAMYGQLGLPIHFGDDGAPYAGDPILAGNRGVTPDHNTSISAVAVLERHMDELRLRVYHNLHAAVLLNADAFGCTRVEQRVKPGDEYISFDS